MSSLCYSHVIVCQCQSLASESDASSSPLTFILVVDVVVSAILLLFWILVEFLTENMLRPWSEKQWRWTYFSWKIIPFHVFPCLSSIEVAWHLSVSDKELLLFSLCFDLQCNQSGFSWKEKSSWIHCKARNLSEFQLSCQFCWEMQWQKGWYKGRWRNLWDHCFLWPKGMMKQEVLRRFIPRGSHYKKKYLRFLN